MSLPIRRPLRDDMFCVRGISRQNGPHKLPLPEAPSELVCMIDVIDIDSRSIAFMLYHFSPHIIYPYLVGTHVVCLNLYDINHITCEDT